MPMLESDAAGESALYQSKAAGEDRLSFTWPVMRFLFPPAHLQNLPPASTGWELPHLSSPPDSL